MREIIYGTTSMKSKKIKPCPFCGGEATLRRDVRYPRPKCNPIQAWEVICKNHKCCVYDADTRYFFSKKAAISAWNDRKLGCEHEQMLADGELVSKEWHDEQVMLLRNEYENEKLFNLAIKNGEVDFSIESETTKSFYYTLVQIFEQNGAKNFFTTSIDIDGKKGRYAFTIEKVGGQTVAEKLAEKDKEIKRLTEENEGRFHYESHLLNMNDNLNDEIADLKKQVYEYKRKIEQGTLIELKYPLHKAVYFLRNGAVEEGVIVSFNYNRYTNPKMWYSIEYYIPALKSYYVEVVREDMVYPTREEVEKRLKGAQE